MEKKFEVICLHNREECNNNKDDKCMVHCLGSWEFATKAQAQTLKAVHISNTINHRPQVYERLDETCQVLVTKKKRCGSPLYRPEHGDKICGNSHEADIYSVNT